MLGQYLRGKGITINEQGRQPSVSQQIMLESLGPL